jgi:hypothetical protein
MRNPSTRCLYANDFDQTAVLLVSLNTNLHAVHLVAFAITSMKLVWRGANPPKPRAVWRRWFKHERRACYAVWRPKLQLEPIFGFRAAIRVGVRVQQ